MKEYREAKKELDRVYREEKKKLAANIQPIFFKQFAAFFEVNPEVKSIKFDITSDIYDDENYSHGVESVTVRLEDEHVNDDNDYLFEDGYGWEDIAWTIRDEPELFPTIDAKRCTKLSKAIDKVGEVIKGCDIDFLEDVFDPDTNVTITKKGFTIE